RVAGGDCRGAGGLESYTERLAAGNQRRIGRHTPIAVRGSEVDGVVGADNVPVGVYGVDRDVKSYARGLGRGRAGLTRAAARRGRLTRRQQLQLGEGTRSDRDRRTGVDGNGRMGGITGGDGGAASSLKGHTEDLGASD